MQPFAIQNLLVDIKLVVKLYIHLSAFRISLQQGAIERGAVDTVFFGNARIKIVEHLIKIARHIVVFFQECIHAPHVLKSILRNVNPRRHHRIFQHNIMIICLVAESLFVDFLLRNIDCRSYGALRIAVLIENRCVANTRPPIIQIRADFCHIAFLQANLIAYLWHSCVYRVKKGFKLAHISRENDI